MTGLFKKFFNCKIKSFTINQGNYIIFRNNSKNAFQILSTNDCNSSNIKSPLFILGIETSCDDTGAAVVNNQGQVLGEGYYSQVEASVKFGGILPSLAAKYHRSNINKAVREALEKSHIKPTDLTAVAVTVKPGNVRSLKVGCTYGKLLALQYKLPFIPIHHMEAHALTVRMGNKVEFPFVVLLVSGGHCILCIAHSVNKWSVLGNTRDTAPGVCLDQLARRLKLRHLPGLNNVIGGKQIEILAEKGDPQRFKFTPQNIQHRDGNFSIAYIEKSCKDVIFQLENEKGIEGGDILEEDVNDICASLQYSIVKHLIRKTQLGLKFAELTNRIPPENKTLVVSGGVASNQFLRNAFELLCKAEGYRLLVPPPKLCTDNGIMIAWNGLEKWRMGLDILRTEEEIGEVSVQSKCPLGPDLTQEFRETKIDKFHYVKII